MAKQKVKTFDPKRDAVRRPQPVALTVRFPNHRKADLNHYLEDHIYLASLNTVINHAIMAAVEKPPQLKKPERGDGGMRADASESMEVRFPPAVYAKIEGLAIRYPDLSRTQIINQLVAAGLTRLGYESTPP